MGTCNHSIKQCLWVEPFLTGRLELRVAGGPLFEMVDEAGHGGRSEPVVDIDDGDSRDAAVQHCQKSRQAAEARSVAHTRRDRDDGNAHEASDDTGQCTLHSGDHNNDVR